MTFNLRRPWQTWLAFGVGLSLVLTAMAWVSAKVLELDERGQATLARAQFEEKVRLALWRLDSVAAPIIASEAAQPYFTYRALYPAQAAYSAMFSAIEPGSVLLASPLLGLRDDMVRLHFQQGPGGALTSPQVPRTAEHRNAAKDFVSAARLGELSRRLADLGATLGRPQLERLAKRLPAARARPLAPAPIRASAPPGARETVSSPQTSIASTIDTSPVVTQQQVALNSKEFAQRASSYGAAGDSQSNALMYKPTKKRPKQSQRRAAEEPTGAAPTDPRPEPMEGVMTPLWESNELLLARRVTIGEDHYIQGAWLDWPGLERRLLDSVDDLLPHARLVEIGELDATPTSRRLASLPVRLDPGAMVSAGTSGLTPLQLSLIIAWAALLVGALGVAALMRGALALSERRGTFVSAVTHELRTPLTTFRMYTEMLAQGMIREPAKQRRYLNTLHAQAERLGHLVDNVLLYAGLERRPDAREVERLDAKGILERVAPPLSQRSEQAGLRLTTRCDSDPLDLCCMGDANAVERIVFNLVDNACKYAAAHSEREELHLIAFRADADHIGIAVRDFGLGIDPTEAATIFRAFHKSAKKAAQTAPGVGLGLALCRGLAVAMGGRLRLQTPATGPGARFELLLPAAK